MSFDNNLWLMHGDCLERMKEIPDGSVDAVICDPPFAVTDCAWDVVIDFEAMWRELRRVAKTNAAFVLFAKQPFTTDLIQSNRKEYKYNWSWQKPRVTGFLNAKRMPMTAHEDVCVFYRAQPTYHHETDERNPRFGEATTVSRSPAYGEKDSLGYTRPQYIVKKSILSGFQIEQRGLHPTQKPVALMQYLIKTYTNEGETVLDFTMGSGTTGVAALNCGRKFIGIERDDAYFEIAQRRIEDSRGLF